MLTCEQAYFCDQDAGPSCLFRFKDIVFTRPEDGGVYGPLKPLEVSAKLNLVPGAPADFYPGSLPLSLPAGLPSNLSLSHLGNGNYSLPTVDVSNLNSSGTYSVTTRYDGTDGGISQTKQFTIDRDAPVLELRVQTAPARPNALWTDAGWRRDEMPLLLVSASEGIQAVSVVLAKSDAGVSAAAGLETCTDAGVLRVDGGCSSDNCKCFQLDLARPPLPALSGQFVVTANASDLTNNPSAGISTAVVEVTRQRWAASLNAGVGYPKAGAAVDSAGNVYVGISNGLSGFKPTGAPATSATTGPIDATPAIGSLADGGQLVLFGVAGVGGGLNALNVQTGALTGGSNCGAAATGGTPSGIAVTTLTYTSTAHLAVVGAANDVANSALQAYLPVPSNCVAQSALNSPNVSMDFPANPVVKGKIAYLPTRTGANIRAYSWIDNSNWAALTAGEQGFPVSLAGSGNFNGLAMHSSGSKLVGGGGVGIGQLFQLPASGGDGGVDWKYPAANTAPVGAPAVWTAAEIFYGVEDAIPTLRKVGQFGDGGVSATEPDGGLTNTTGFVSTSPVLGEGNLVYAVSQGGQLSVFSRDLVRLWVASNFGTVTGSPNLDCNRSRLNGPGVLYIASQDGNLYSILVDSPKLSTTADWPKYQHDAQNSGNPDMPRNLGCP